MRTFNHLYTVFGIGLITALLHFSAMAETPWLQETLPNGLQVIIKENHTAPVADLRIFVRTGSIYENEYLGAGISHLFEHLINGGSTTTHSEEEINDLIDKLGGANNAYTTKDHTCYFITTSGEMIFRAVELLADWMTNCTFPEPEFKREMGVVIEELRKANEEPDRIIHQLLDDTMFRVHPTRYPVIGYEHLIQGITRNDILNYYHQRYAPNNLVVVAVGDFSAPQVMEKISEAFSRSEPRPPPALALPAEPVQVGPRERTMRRKGLGEAYFILAYHTIPIDHPDLFALDVLSYVLSQGRSSRLVKAVMEEQRLVSSIYSYSATPSYDAGVFAITGTCKDTEAEAALSAIYQELERIKTEPAATGELNKAIKQKQADEVLGRQTAAAEASEIGINMITTGNPNFGDVYMRGIQAVTVADLQRVAVRYFHENNRTLVMLRPETERQSVESSALKVSSSQIHKTVLPNGLRVLVKRNPNIPLINAQMLFLGGVLSESPEQAGICRITTEMLTRGTISRSRDDIAGFFDRCGGRYSVTAGNNTLGLSMEVLREDFPQALTVFADMIKNPIFPATELETVRKNTLAAIATRNDDWNSELSYYFKKRFFSPHPYANDSLGKEESVAGLTAADLKIYYDKFVNPSQGVLAVFGDLDENETLKMIENAFGDLPAREENSPLPNRPQPTPVTENRVSEEAVNKQLSAVYIGYPGIAITDHEDRFALTVLDTILSGFNYPGGRLHHRLRGGDKDLVYIVHAFNFVGIDPGFFGIMAASSPAKMNEVIAIILEEIEKIKATPVGDEELNTARIVCTTMEKLSRQTNSDMALQAVLDELCGLGYDFSDRYTELIGKVTAADVQRVANKYLTHYVQVRTVPANNPR